MDDPGMSLFQGKGLDVVDNNENQEEAEDLEEQIRRREEVSIGIAVIYNIQLIFISAPKFVDKCSR